MSDQMQHTPTPWVATNGDPNYIGKTADHPADAILICRMVDKGPGFLVSHDEQRANAHFIIRACNNHEPLLEACELFVEAWESRQSWPSKEQVDRARKVIAAAKGTTE